MVRRLVTVTTPTGLHARPAAEFVRAAQSFSSAVRVRYGEREVDGKSILGVLSLGVPQNGEITLVVDGPDEEAAVSILVGILTLET